MRFHEKLRALRKEKGLSQEELADIVGVSRQAMSKWESGQTFPETEKLIALSELFGVTIDSMLKEGEVEHDKDNPHSVPYWAYRRQHFERKSEKTLFGVPLVHVNIGFGVKARGIIAVGNNAKGVIAIGLLARGVISLGILSVGVISFGTFCFGLLALGAVAAGIVAGGAVAVGLMAFGAVAVGMVSVGACAIASHVAIGDYASGQVAIGRIVRGATTVSSNAPSGERWAITSVQVRAAITKEFPNMWNWLVDFLSSFFR